MQDLFLKPKSTVVCTGDIESETLRAFNWLGWHLALTERHRR